MRGRGFLFAISPLDAQCVRQCADSPALARYVVELAETSASSHHAELDSTWLAIHFCLRADPARPLAARALLGGDPIPAGPEMSGAIVGENEVPALAAALSAVDEGAFREAFAATSRDTDGEFFEYDIRLGWIWFQRMRALYRRAARDGRAVLFAMEDRLVRPDRGARPAA